MERLENFRELVDPLKDIFPENAEFDDEHNFARGSCKLSVSWKLNNDINRPNKSSKIILIILPDELIDDYCKNTQENKRLLQEKLKKYITAKYKLFNPDHNNSKYNSPPIEEWLVQSNYFD